MRTILLSTLIGALVIAAVTGIIIVAFGSWSEVEAKILATTALIGGFSLTGLCSAVLYEQRRVQPFAIFGMVLSLAAFTVLLAVIWEWVTSSEEVLRLLFTLIGLALSTAHASLMLLIVPRTTLLRIAQWGTLVANLVFTVLVLYPIIWNADIQEVYMRSILVFAILAAFGTLLTPILYKAYEPAHLHKLESM